MTLKFNINFNMKRIVIKWLLTKYSKAKLSHFTHKKEASKFVKYKQQYQLRIQCCHSYLSWPGSCCNYQIIAQLTLALCAQLHLLHVIASSHCMLCYAELTIHLFCTNMYALCVPKLSFAHRVLHIYTAAGSHLPAFAIESYAHHTYMKRAYTYSTP